MAHLYEAMRRYVNYFQPSFKLAEKRRDGSAVIKRYSPPATPCERVMRHEAGERRVSPSPRRTPGHVGPNGAAVHHQGGPISTGGDRVPGVQAHAAGREPGTVPGETARPVA